MMKWEVIYFYTYIDIYIDLPGVTLGDHHSVVSFSAIFLPVISSHPPPGPLSRCCDQPTKALTMDTMPSNPQVPATGADAGLLGRWQ